MPLLKLLALCFFLVSHLVCAANVILKTPQAPQRKFENDNPQNERQMPLSVPQDGYIVQAGDTLFGIARMYGTSHIKIIEANNMQEGDIIKIGQKLIIPQVSVRSLEKPQSQPQTQVNKVTSGDGTHIVRDGETLFGIARTYNVSPIDLATENGVDLTYMLRIGQKMKIPSGSSIVVAERNVPETKTVTQQDVKRNIRDKLSDRKINCDHPFSWPVYSTEILHGYGESLKNGTKLDGVVIASEVNKNIVASYSGEVAYAGSDIPEYGNLMIVKHKDNWMTIYGYLNAFTKKVGDKVNKGDLLGTVGQTGDADGPSLYFSIRKVKTPYNPELCI